MKEGYNKSICSKAYYNHESSLKRSHNLHTNSGGKIKKKENVCIYVRVYVYVYTHVPSTGETSRKKRSDGRFYLNYINSYIKMVLIFTLKSKHYQI